MWPDWSLRNRSLSSLWTDKLSIYCPMSKVKWQGFSSGIHPSGVSRSTSGVAKCKININSKMFCAFDIMRSTPCCHNIHCFSPSSFLGERGCQLQDQKCKIVQSSWPTWWMPNRLIKQMPLILPQIIMITMSHILHCVAFDDIIFVGPLSVRPRRPFSYGITPA